MTHPATRLVNVLLGVDETANSLFGGKPKETVSGTVGRALMLPYPPIWAKASRWIIDGVFGPGHCARNAADEIAARQRAGE